MPKRKPDMDKVWIGHAERLTMSRNGNPRFLVTFYHPDGQWTYQTSSDASYSYDVENWLRTRTLLNVWLTKADRIDYMEPVK